MSVRKFRLCAGVVAIIGITASTVSADPVVIYSNFGSSPEYVSPGWVNSDENVYSMGFQPVASAQLTSVMLPVQWGDELPVGGLSVSLFLRPDFWPQGLAGLIEEIVVPLPGAAQPGTISMLTLTSMVRPLLSADTLYFLRVIVTPPSTFPGITTSWPMNNAGIQGLVVNTFPGGISSTRGTLGAFQLNGDLSPTPEPSTMLMFATGAALAVQRVRRRRLSG